MGKEMRMAGRAVSDSKASLTPSKGKRGKRRLVEAS